MTPIYYLPDLIRLDLNKKKEISGIYLWGVKTTTGHIPLYIGKSKKIPQRIYEHLCSWRGGAYKIPKWNDVGKKNWKIVHIPESFADFKKLLTNSAAKVTVENVIKDFFCCWEVLPDYRTARVEEDALASLMNKKKLISNHLKKDTAETKISRQFYDDFMDESMNTSP